jgi:hypothetical protein
MNSETRAMNSLNYDGPFMVAENILDLVLDLPDVAQDVIDFLIATRRIR